MIPNHLTGKELFKWLHANKRLLIDAKKSNIKEADGFAYVATMMNPEATKTINDDESVTALKRQLIINTTYWFDSHRDVHIDGLWKKSLSDTDVHYLIKQHSMTFENVIDDESKAYTRKIDWRELGVDFDGKTEALIFDSNIIADRHPFMFNQYRKGYVKNHSVGMRYVDIALAINNEDYKEEFAEWNKYIGKIANRKAVDEVGYFFPVKQAAIVEGSAVVKGSNIITPVYGEHKSSSTISEPEASTPEQPRYDGEKLANLFFNLNLK